MKGKTELLNEFQIFSDPSIGNVGESNSKSMQFFILENY
jgi:hypothetical protein